MKDGYIPPFGDTRGESPEPCCFRLDGKPHKAEVSPDRLQITISELSKRGKISIAASAPIINAFVNNEGTAIVCLYGEDRPADFFSTKTGEKLNPQHFQHSA